LRNRAELAGGDQAKSCLRTPDLVLAAEAVGQLPGGPQAGLGPLGLAPSRPRSSPAPAPDPRPGVDPTPPASSSRRPPCATSCAQFDHSWGWGYWAQLSRPRLTRKSANFYSCNEH
jgi:hypothetical protein